MIRTASRVAERASVALLALSLAACDDEATAPLSVTPPSDGGVEDAGPPWGEGCAPGELAAQDGGCVLAGVPPERCGAGFEPDGDHGCRALLPEGPCPDATFAVPGDAACHAVDSCDPARWQALVDAGAVVVDAGFAGPDPDGSPSKPWPTIGQALSAAPLGAAIAIAPGTYAEDVSIASEPRSLHGACAGSVTIAGTGIWTLFVGAGASGTVLSGLSITGPGVGVGVSGSERVVIDRVRIHDTEDWGIDVEDSLGPTDVTVSSSLVERSRGFGVFASGPAARVAIARALVRDVKPSGADPVAAGVLAQAGAEADLTTSVIEGVGFAGFWTIGARAAARTSVIRDVAAIDGLGNGVLASSSDIDGRRSELSLESAIVSRVDGVGISVEGSDATIDAVVVREGLSTGSASGWGILAQSRAPAGQADVVVRHTLVDGAHELGVGAVGALAALSGLRVRNTLPNPDGLRGRGVVVQDDVGVPSVAQLSGSVVEESREVGVFVAGAELAIDATVVAATALESDGTRGAGVHVQRHGALAAMVTMSRSLVDGCHTAGVLGNDAKLVITSSWIRNVAPASGGLFGDGVAVVSTVQSEAVVTASRIEGSARSGVASFGGLVELRDTTFECNAIQLNGEENFGLPAVFEDLGGNVCGCAGETVSCAVLASQLAAPDPVSR